MVKNYLDNGHSTYPISQNEIYGVKTFNWEDFSWKYLSLIGDEQVISLMHTKVCVFSNSVLCLRKMNVNQILHGKTD